MSFDLTSIDLTLTSLTLIRVWNLLEFYVCFLHFSRLLMIDPLMTYPDLRKTNHGFGTLQLKP